MNWKKGALLLVIVAAIASFFAFDLNQYLNLQTLQQHKTELDQWVIDNRLLAVAAFFVFYVAVTALSLPGAALMTLAAGAIFGLLWGTVIVSFASSMGASLAFLASRFLFQESVEQRFRKQMRSVNAGIEKEGAFYLFTLRLVPLFPFFVINLVMGLTQLRLWTFYWVSQVGMLAGTIVYVNAGTQLAQLESASGILSADLILSFTLLGLFPLLAKRLVDWVQRRRVLKPYPKPKQFDRNMVVIGGGSAGLVASYIAAAVKAKVTLIERDKMGGDCLNTGCVPSKALIRSAKFAADAKRANELGFKNVTLDFDFADVMDRVKRVIQRVEPHDSVERYTELGVECLQGSARITSPYTVEVNGQTLTTQNIVIATGAKPFVPPIEGIDQIDYLTSDNLWELRELPKRLVILGGGPIGCEMTQAFTRLGSEVTQVEMLPRILIREDEDVSAFVTQRLQQEGVQVKTEHKAKTVVQEDGEKYLICEHQGQDVRIPFDQLLVAIGRKANTQGLGLEELGIGTTASGTVETNEYLQTRFPNIYASGDVAGPYQFTHTAAHQSWYAAVNALFGFAKKFKADYSVIPWVTFTDPEVAHVGWNEQQAREQEVAFEVTRFDIAELDRAIAEEANYGFVKVITEKDKDKILGVTIVGDHAGELIAEYVLAMKRNVGLNKILGTIHVYPTMAEANKYAAGEWKQAHKPERVLQWLEKFHQWRLGSRSAVAPATNAESGSR